MKLTNAQKEAIECVDFPCQIVSTAGSGKTTCMAYKFSYLVNIKKYLPHKILAITFTNKAAKELKEKVIKFSKVDPNSLIWIRTVHSSCLQIIKPNLDKLEFKSPITIYDAGNQKTLITKIYKEVTGRKNSEEILYFKSYISKAKNSLDQYDYINHNKCKLPGIFDIMIKYDQELKNNNAMDFDDILKYSYKLLKNEEDIKNEYKNNFQYIIVDEAQDTNDIQFKIIELLSQENNITIIGDNSQSIYSFRSAKPKLFIDFNQRYSNTKLIKLEENFRSNKNIVNLTNKIIEGYDPLNKNCYSNKSNGILPISKEFSDDIQEASWISDKCKIMYDQKNISLNEIAILYRSKFLSRIFEKELTKLGVPYKVVGGVSFFERKEIKDLLAFLSCINNNQDFINFERIINIPKRGIGVKTVDKILNISGDDFKTKIVNFIKTNSKSKIRTSIIEFFKMMEDLKDKKPSIILEDILNKYNYKDYIKEYSNDEEELNDRLENIEELIEISRKFLDIDSFLEECSLFQENDNSENTQDKISLMTTHACKGLEFDCVFVVGCEDNLFPHYRACLEAETPEQLEEKIDEERRLFYVACSRAKKYLILTNTLSRNSRDCIPSRFLEDIKDYVNDKYDG